MNDTLFLRWKIGRKKVIQYTSTYSMYFRIHKLLPTKSKKKKKNSGSIEIYCHGNNEFFKDILWREISFCVMINTLYCDIV